MSPATLSNGMPIEIGRIDKELKALWAADGGAKTRASLINLAVFCHGAAALEENTALIAEFTKDHACRALLIAAEPLAAKRHTQAWISAHCHVSRAGAKQICCEQITFLLQGASPEMVRNILFSHLDSDLPLYLWWREDLPNPIDAQLWTWVDRLIFDSQAWAEPAAQFERLQQSLTHTKSRMVLCDLNWTRLLPLRWVLAQIFDHPDHLAELPALDRVEIAHAPGFRSTAVLLLGWLSSQLGWKFAGKNGDTLEFANWSGAKLMATLRAEGSAPISHCQLGHGAAAFCVQRLVDSAFYAVSADLGGGPACQNKVPSGPEDVLSLLDQELMRGGKHQVYLRALSAAQPML